MKNYQVVLLSALALFLPVPALAQQAVEGPPRLAQLMEEAEQRAAAVRREIDPQSAKVAELGRLRSRYPERHDLALQHEGERTRLAGLLFQHYVGQAEFVGRMKSELSTIREKIATGFSSKDDPLQEELAFVRERLVSIRSEVATKLKPDPDLNKEGEVRDELIELVRKFDLETEKERLLLAQQQQTDHRVEANRGRVAILDESIRNVEALRGRLERRAEFLRIAATVHHQQGRMISLEFKARERVEEVQAAVKQLNTAIDPTDRVMQEHFPEVVTYNELPVTTVNELKKRTKEITRQKEEKKL